MQRALRSRGARLIDQEDGSRLVIDAANDAGDKPLTDGDKKMTLALVRGIDEGQLTLWREHLQDLGDLLDEHEVRGRLGSQVSRQLESWYRSGRLLGLDTSDGRILYPTFQFGSTGRPVPAVKVILEVFRGAAKSPYTVASWLVSPNSLLEQNSPVRWLSTGRSTALLEEAARRTAARLAL